MSSYPLNDKKKINKLASRFLKINKFAGGKFSRPPPKKKNQMVDPSGDCAGV